MIPSLQLPARAWEKSCNGAWDEWRRLGVTTLGTNFCTRVMSLQVGMPAVVATFRVRNMTGTGVPSVQHDVVVDRVQFDRGGGGGLRDGPWCVRFLHLSGLSEGRFSRMLGEVGSKKRVAPFFCRIVVVERSPSGRRGGHLSQGPKQAGRMERNMSPNCVESGTCRRDSYFSKGGGSSCLAPSSGWKSISRCRDTCCSHHAGPSEHLRISS